MSVPEPLKARKSLETSKDESDTSDTDSDIEAAARSISAPKPQLQQPLIFSANSGAAVAPPPPLPPPSYRYKITIQYPLTDPKSDSAFALLIQFCCACCPDVKVKEGNNLDKATLISRLETQILYKLEHENVESFQVEIYDGSNNTFSSFNTKEGLLQFMQSNLDYQTFCFNVKSFGCPKCFGYCFFHPKLNKSGMQYPIFCLYNR